MTGGNRSPFGLSQETYLSGGNEMNVSVIFHIDENQKWALLLKNVRNFMQAAENKTTVEVLANSDAVEFYLRNNSDSGVPVMRELSARGVRFVACGNALRGYGIPKEQLAPFVDVVPAGVLELVEKQMEGYAYIKP